MVGKIPWRRERLPTPGFWPGEFHGLDTMSLPGGLGAASGVLCQCPGQCAKRRFLFDFGACISVGCSPVSQFSRYTHTAHKSFPHSSVGKESACDAGDPGLIPGLVRSAGEGIGSPLQYSWASLVAQLVKNQPAMWETWIQSLGWEDPLEKGKATHSSILAWRIPWTIKSMGSQRVGHD